MALIDISFAFDTVDHATLLSVLRSGFSITGQALSWFQSHLTDRTLIFTLTSNHSLLIPLVAGMPQGSGIGPTQFISYTENTTDIFQKQGIQYHLFANDIPVYSFSQVRDAPALLSRLSDCIGELATAYASHRLQLNATKSEFLWFGSRSVLSKIFIK